MYNINILGALLSGVNNKCARPRNAMQIRKGIEKMAFVPTLGAIEVVVHFTLAGLPCSITLTIGTGGVPPSSQQLEDATNVVNTWATTQLGDFLSAQLAFTGATGYDQTSVSSPVFNVINSPPIPGAVNISALPMNVSTVSSLRTGNRGRSSRGRNFVTGIPETMQLDPAHSSVQFATDILGAYLGLITSVSLAGFTLNVNSTITNGQSRLSGFLQQVEAIIVDNEFDTKDRTPIK